MIINFFARGEPKGQPRARAFSRKMGDKVMVRMYDPSTAEGWKSCIAMAARPYLPSVPFEGPLKVSIAFYMPRPKKHFGTGKRATVLRDDAPVWYIPKPDRDNLDKAVLDALTTLGMWKDDCQACDGSISKVYAHPTAPIGALITIETL